MKLRHACTKYRDELQRNVFEDCRQLILVRTVGMVVQVGLSGAPVEHMDR